MLRRFHVSGFKSLEDFDLVLQAGLNVIIGPNGSGKTNIISFIEFLANISRHSLLDAVSRSGGAGRIFRRSDNGTLAKKITFTIQGEGNSRDYRSDGTQFVRYEYSAEISISETGALKYARQQVRMAYVPLDLFEGEWPVVVKASITSEDNPELAVDIKGEEYLRDLSRTKSDPIRAKAEMEELIRDSCHNSALFQLISRYVRGASLISGDLFGAKSLNISPSAVRKPEDIASEPEISEDGSGLAAVLFSLSNAKDRGYMSHWNPFLLHRDPDEDYEEIFEQIISYSRIVNDSIHRISVEPDTIENQLRIFLTVNYGKRFLKLPFSLVSDGTAKWFTLVTAIVTSPSLFAIEEPENYLHPLMQKEIVRIVRDTFSPERKDGFAVMTTHSETILNSVDPEEMILVHMDNGKTVAKRPSNSLDIRREINETGFGAGYYYLAGAIE